MSFYAAVRDRIVSDTVCVANLDTFNSVPALFQFRSHPDFTPDETPYIIVRRPNGDESQATFSQNSLRDILILVSIYAALPQNSTFNEKLETLAEQARSLFNKKSFRYSGKTYAASVTGPVAVPTEAENLLGLGLTLRLQFGG